MGIPRDRPEAGGQIRHPASSLVVVIDDGNGADRVAVGSRGSARKPYQQRRRPHERDGVECQHEFDVRDGQEQSSDRRPDEESDALDRRGNDVGAREFLRVRRQAREQGGLGGPEGLARACRRERQRVHRQRRPVERDQGHHSEHEGGSDDIGADHHQLLRILVGERGEQGPGEGHREVAHDAEQPDRGRATFAIHPDRDRSAVRPIADHRTAERQVDPAQIPVLEDVAERRSRLPQLLGDRRHPAPPAITTPVPHRPPAPDITARRRAPSRCGAELSIWPEREGRAIVGARGLALDLVAELD